MAQASAARLLDEGKSLRATVPREDHAAWDPPADRPDPIDILEQQAATRIPELVPIRYGRMAESAFACYRGGAAIMASDLAATPSSGLKVQVCGDAHVANFGFFASPDRRLVFDLNDFDETLPAPFEWDVKRLAASVVIAGRSNGFSRRDQRAAVRETVAAYQRAMAGLAKLPFLQAWYWRIETEALVESLSKQLRREAGLVKRATARAERRTNLGTLDKLTTNVDGRYRITPRPPVIVGVPRGQRRAASRLVDAALAGYLATLAPERRIVVRHYKRVDVARKVSGVGSVGTDGYVVLLLGQRDDDPLFLQFKQAQESVLAPYAGPSEYTSHGERVVRGQRIMQATGDAFLGWYDAPPPIEREFYIRQLRDKKGALDTTEMGASTLARYGGLCGASLARAHGRSDQIARLAGYIGKGKPFARAIERFALAYADQNERDYQALLDAEREGRIEVRRGV
jgi:uncharacterized protein (DUF2252 family)